MKMQLIDKNFNNEIAYTIDYNQSIIDIFNMGKEYSNSSFYWWKKAKEVRNNDFELADWYFKSSREYTERAYTVMDILHQVFGLDEIKDYELDNCEWVQI